MGDLDQSEIENGVLNRKLNHWSEFVELIRVRHAYAPAYIYRGQASDWPLLSSLDRLEKKFPTRKNYAGGVPAHFDCPPASRSQHLQAFKESARVLGTLDPDESDDEWWTLARHHGLATPIMDWTSSPFVALFFAFEDEKVEQDGQLVEPQQRLVFRVSWHLLAGDDGEVENAPRPFFPKRAATQRMLNQESVCVFMPEGIDLMDLIKQAYPNESSSKKPVWARAILEKIQIKNEDRIGCLQFLNKMRINRMTMFPDLDGAAAYVNALWELDFSTPLGSLQARSAYR